MAKRNKKGGVFQALLLAASVAALSAGVAHAQGSGDLSGLAEQILNNPQDVQLNLAYARAAEAAGKPRLALAAYERILINDPTNVDARQGYERLRRIIEPGYTVSRVEVGARWDSNPANVGDPFGFFDPEEATTYYGHAMIANESTFLGRRWRSILNVNVEETPDIDELNYEYIGAQTGPIFYVGPHLAAIPSIGGAVAWLGGDHYYDEINLGLTVEGRAYGASYWWRLRGGYRDYDLDTSFFFTPTLTDNGSYLELMGGASKPHVFLERDTVTVAPFIRYSDVEGDAYDFWVNDYVAPGSYTEYGVDVNYNYQITEHLQTSVGVLARERDFTSSSRGDTYISPQASLTLQNALPCSCDLRLQYRYRDNDSNSLDNDYDANQVSLQLAARF